MKCMVPGCENPSKTKGYCGKHYRRFHLYGDVNHVEKVYEHPSECTVSGCDNPYQTNGLCNMHYLRFKKYGDPLYIEQTHERHGLRNTPEYEIWAGMKARCYNEKHIRYKRYGGRGIKVCERWLNSFQSFYDDMGKRPSDKYQIDRIDTNGDYEPNNCRWVTAEENNQNRSSTKMNVDTIKMIRDDHDNTNMTHLELAKKYGISKAQVTSIVNNKTWKNINEKEK